MKLPEKLTAEQNEALISIIQLLAAHGRAIRLQREQAEKENRADAGSGRDFQNDTTATNAGGVCYAQE